MSDTDDEEETVYIGLTVIPHKQLAHIDVFETEAQADAYDERATELANNRPYDVWIESGEVAITKPEDDDE